LTWILSLAALGAAGIAVGGFVLPKKIELLPNVPIAAFA
jgi:hypothetical protein